VKLIGALKCEVILSSAKWDVFEGQGPAKVCQPQEVDVNVEVCCVMFDLESAPMV